MSDVPKDTKSPGETKETRSTTESTQLGRSAIQGEIGKDSQTSVEPSEINEIKTDNFEIDDWSGYPEGPRPEGPFQIIEGKEYDDARSLANRTNSEMHRKDPSLNGKQIHEIKPIKFGGSPIEIDNKIALTKREHAKYTTWWNRKLHEFEGSS